MQRKNLTVNKMEKKNGILEKKTVKREKNIFKSVKINQQIILSIFFNFVIFCYKTSTHK